MAQYQCRVERFARRGEEWVLTEFTDGDGTVPLAATGRAPAPREVYDRVAFPDETSDGPAPD